MSESIFQQPTPEQLAAFVAGDPIAEDEVLRLVLPQLYRWANRHYPNLVQSDVQSVINQVVAETCRPYVRYDPSKSKLTTYLIRLIKLRLVDLYEKEKKINDFEDSDPSIHEKLLKFPYNKVDSLKDSTHIAREKFFQEAENSLDNVEREFLRLMRQGEKKQEVFVAVLKQYDSISDPIREVKNTKERLNRKLKVIARKLDYRLEDLLDD